jgi:hypothetical protein
MFNQRVDNVMVEYDLGFGLSTAGLNKNSRKQTQRLKRKFENPGPIVSTPAFQLRRVIEGGNDAARNGSAPCAT